MHAAIERMAKAIEVRVPYEWEVVACLAREKTKKPYIITHVQHDTVKDWKQVNKIMKINNVTQDTEGGVVLLGGTRHLKRLASTGCVMRRLTHRQYFTSRRVISKILHVRK